MKYKIKKIKVYPNEPIEWEKGAYLGMSMNNTIFHNYDSIDEMLQFIVPNTKNFLVLVGDHLHRYNEQIFSGYDEEKAAEVSIAKGKTLTNMFSSVADKYKNVKFEFTYTKDFLKDETFKERIHRFKCIYNSNNHFRELVNYTINVFLRRQAEIKIPYDSARGLCEMYLFEELAIFEVLAEEWKKINIYPGNQLPIIKELVLGKLKGVSELLEQIQAVEIKFRPS